MQDKHLYEYAVIRVVPRVEREEFLNIGVILYEHLSKFLDVKFVLQKERLQAFSDIIDLAELEAILQAFSRICRGCEGSGPIGQLDTASRFRWLTARRSTILQTSSVHSGFCTEPAEELNRLFERLIL